MHSRDGAPCRGSLQVAGVHSMHAHMSAQFSGSKGCERVEVRPAMQSTHSGADWRTVTLGLDTAGLGLHGICNASNLVWGLTLHIQAGRLAEVMSHLQMQDTRARCADAMQMWSPRLTASTSVGRAKGADFGCSPWHAAKRGKLPAERAPDLLCTGSAGVQQPVRATPRHAMVAFRAGMATPVTATAMQATTCRHGLPCLVPGEILSVHQGLKHLQRNGAAQCGELGQAVCRFC